MIVSSDTIFLKDNINVNMVSEHFVNQKLLIFFLILNANICCGYSLEVPHQGVSNDYPQHMFSWRHKKNSVWIPLLSGAMV